LWPVSFGAAPSFSRQRCLAQTKDDDAPCATLLRRYMPLLDWGRDYSRDALQNDLIAAVIVTIMLIPQSLAYALLAGLPPEAGLYASILPIILYAIFGTSRALAVGPVAVVSLMTAAAVGQVADQGTAGYAVAALTLAVLSGGILLAMGLLRLGFLANFLSHPVIAGFITASGILIAFSQAQAYPGHRGAWPFLPQILYTLAHGRREPDHTGPWRRGHGVPVLGAQGAEAVPASRGRGPKAADVAQKAGPVAAVVVTTLLVWALALPIAVWPSWARCRNRCRR
jgi:SulP family sulfate permease